MVPSPVVVNGLATSSDLYVPEDLIVDYKRNYSGNNVYPLTDWKDWGTGIASADGAKFHISVSCGVATVSGLSDGEQVSFYTLDGRFVGTQRVENCKVSLPVLPLSADVIIARIGKQSIKVMLR